MSASSEDNATTILIVDDHPVVRDGLTAMLSTYPDMRVVGEAADGAAALDCYRKLRPAIVLCDLLLPDMNGVDVIRKICSSFSEAQIIVLTTVAADEEIYQALEAGARGYLLKDTARAELVQAIRAVVAGRRYIPTQIGGRLAECLPHQALSPREIQVLELVAAGFRSKEIAYKLTISEATANAHVKHIVEKLHANDRAHAVFIALRRGFMRL